MRPSTVCNFTRSAVVFFLFGASPMFAQSTITLDSFPLRRPAPAAEVPEPVAPPTGVASCLFAAEGCAEEQGSGRSFSLDDVVNLGIVDRREVAVAATGDRAEADRMAQPLPSIDLEVLFEYGSDQLQGGQIGDLYALAQELRGVDFSGRRLVLMGHTDAAGSAAFNRDLSLRRAQSVAEFLSREAGIPRDRIRTAGMGFDYLKYPADPLSGANRRVQILLVEG
jgi:outer membrane protein OmpA-like peptidoglycan-associated protein